MPTIWRVFIINGCLSLSNIFSIAIGMVISFLFFSLLMWCITLIDVQTWKNPCIPGINPSWFWFIILLIHYWIWFASILLRIFVSMFINNIDHNSLFLVIFSVVSLSGFNIRVMMASWNEFESVPSLAIFCKNFRRAGNKSSLNVI